MNNLQVSLNSEDAMVAFGESLSAAITSGVVYLKGELGAGKTTLCRGIVNGLGHKGAVKSPTYTLVEPYQLGDAKVFHFDLYRLADPEELEYMGIRDYFVANNLCIVEWPERGEGVLPQPDIEITIELEGKGRLLTLIANSEKGRRAMAVLGSATIES